MAFDKAMSHLQAKGYGDRVIVPQEETAGDGARADCEDNGV